MKTNIRFERANMEFSFLPFPFFFFFFELKKIKHFQQSSHRYQKKI
jgi:hypothetical protein